MKTRLKVLGLILSFALLNVSPVFAAISPDNSLDPTDEENDGLGSCEVIEGNLSCDNLIGIVPVEYDYAVLYINEIPFTPDIHRLTQTEIIELLDIKLYDVTNDRVIDYTNELLVVKNSVTDYGVVLELPNGEPKVISFTMKEKVDKNTMVYVSTIKGSFYKKSNILYYLSIANLALVIFFLISTLDLLPDDN